LRRTIREDVGFELNLPGTLGLVSADPGAIEQVLVNLSINAQDAMPGGGMIRIEARDVELDDASAAGLPNAVPGRYVMLGVTDTGSGMDEATRLRVFEPFFTTKEPGKGTGLGLSTVYGLITQQGGFVAVESTPGLGSTFKVYLPHSTHDSAAGEEIVSSPHALRGTERVLLVEDSETVKKLVRELLESLGYRVIVSDSAIACVAMIEALRDPVDLLVTDVIMPEMNGRELYDRLLRVQPRLKVLFMSGYPSTAIGQLGIDPRKNFLRKPFTKQALSVMVRKALES
jgi:two-component system, cell cycle sensor histidine kinase and response regulator CckA